MIPPLKRFRRPPRPSAIAVLSSVILVLPATRAQAQGVLEDLGTLPGAAGAVAHGVSGDGAVIVGTSGTRAFRWTAEAGMRDLGTLPGASDASARGISEDASVVVGASGGRAYRWTAATGMQDLGLLPGATSASATAVSADGNVVVGEVRYGSSSTHVFRWDAGTGMQDLGADGTAYAWPTGVSGDGSVIVGCIDWSRAFVWTRAGGMYDPFFWTFGYSTASGVSDDGTTVVGLYWDWAPENSYALHLPWTWDTPVGDLPAQENSNATAVDADGSVIVGEFGWPSAMYRWTAGAGLERLGTLPGLAGFHHLPLDVSADGSVVVGRALTADPDVARAFRWVPEIGAPYCDANPNSTGAPGQLRAVGSPTVEQNDVRLLATQLPPNSVVFALCSSTQGYVPNPGGSAGVLCLGGAIGRYVGPGRVQSSGASGDFALSLDLSWTPTPTGYVPIGAGETWNFQVWHRDVVGGNVTSNFTSGIEMSFR